MNENAADEWWIEIQAKRDMDIHMLWKPLEPLKPLKPLDTCCLLDMSSLDDGRVGTVGGMESFNSFRGQSIRTNLVQASLDLGGVGLAYARHISHAGAVLLAGNLGNACQDTGWRRNRRSDRGRGNAGGGRSGRRKRRQGKNNGGCWCELHCGWVMILWDGKIVVFHGVYIFEDLKIWYNRTRMCCLQEWK